MNGINHSTMKKRTFRNKERIMKKYILILLISVTFTIFGLSAGEAVTDTDSPFPLGTPDNTITLDINDLGNGVDHGVFFFNQAANTASLTVLDSSGTPDNLLFGNAFIAADFDLSTIWGTPDESSSFTSPYPAQTPDMVFTLNAGQLNGFNHAVMFMNNFANTAVLVVLDPNGVPDSFLLGYPFIAADFNTPGGTVWYSINGRAWYCLSGCPE